MSDCLLSTGSVDDWELTIAYSSFVEHIDLGYAVTNPLMIQHIQPCATANDLALVFSSDGSAMPQDF